MSHDTLADVVEATATEFGIPGVAVGVWLDGREVHASHGVTSVENPLPVNTDTLFGLRAVSFTAATALMPLVADGRVELDARVPRYLPELVLKDERTAATVTVLKLLNHTSGLGRVPSSTPARETTPWHATWSTSLSSTSPPPGARTSLDSCRSGRPGRSPLRDGFAESSFPVGSLPTRGPVALQA